MRRRRRASMPPPVPTVVETPQPANKARPRHGARRPPEQVGELGRLDHSPRPPIAPPPAFAVMLSNEPPPEPVALSFTSAINPAWPVHGTPTTQSVRDNFAAAKREIESALNSGFTDAPADGVSYGRRDSTWNPVLALFGDVLDGGNFITWW